MKIIPNQDFKSGINTYLKGVEYDVSDEDGAHFIGAGWVGEQPGNGPVEHTLEVQDVVLGHESEVN